MYILQEQKNSFEARCNKRDKYNKLTKQYIFYQNILNEKIPYLRDILMSTTKD